MKTPAKKVTKKEYIDKVAEKLTKDYWNYDKGLKQGKKEALEDVEKIINDWEWNYGNGITFWRKKDGSFIANNPEQFITEIKQRLDSLK